MFPVTRRRFTAFVIFQGADHRRPWRIFTRRGWRHCLIVVPAYYPAPSLTADVYSVVINPLTWGTAIDVIFEHPAKLAQRALEEGATAVIRVPIDQKFERDYIPRGLFTCVTLVKSILGLSAWFVWTPEHLARYLLRNGGKLIERSIDHGVTVRNKEAEARRGNAARAA